MSEFAIEKTVKTKKTHYCWLCGQKIPVHVKAIVLSGYSEDGWFKIYSHLLCNKMGHAVASTVGLDDFSAQEIYANVEERCCDQCAKHDTCTDNPLVCVYTKKYFERKEIR